MNAGSDGSGWTYGTSEEKSARGVSGRGHPMSLTFAVFHFEMSPLNTDPKPENINLGMGCKGWAVHCLHATPPRVAGREAAVHVRSKIGDKERVIAAMISRLSSPSLSTLSGEGRREGEKMNEQRQGSLWRGGREKGGDARQAGCGAGRVPHVPDGSRLPP